MLNVTVVGITMVSPPAELHAYVSIRTRRYELIRYTRVCKNTDEIKESMLL